jgi:hypothetical protein
LIPPADDDSGIAYVEKGADESAVRLISSLAFSSAALACWSVPGMRPRIRSALIANASGASGSCLALMGFESKSVWELDRDSDNVGVWGREEKDGFDEGESGN